MSFYVDADTLAGIRPLPWILSGRALPGAQRSSVASFTWVQPLPSPKNTCGGGGPTVFGEVC